MSSKYLWLTALAVLPLHQRNRFTGTATEINKLSSPELRKRVVDAIRSHQNWSSPNPTPARIQVLPKDNRSWLHGYFQLLCQGKYLLKCGLRQDKRISIECINLRTNSDAITLSLHPQMTGPDTTYLGGLFFSHCELTETIIRVAYAFLRLRHSR